MTGKPGQSSQLPTALPARYSRGFAWQLDRRCKVVRELSADLWELWQDLGGVERLSTQEVMLCERVVYLRQRILEHETAVLKGDAPIMTSGEHANGCNALVGLLKALGLQRRQRLVSDLQDYIAGKASQKSGAA